MGATGGVSEERKAILAGCTKTNALGSLEP
jgi:hypothetical protein